MVDIGLGEAIRALRGELTEAKQEGDGAWMRFQPGSVELELQAVVTRDVHGQIGWKVLEVGASGESATTQTVRLTLTPQWWDPQAKQYKTDFLVAGDIPAAVATRVPDAAHGRAKSGEATPVPSQLPETDADPE